MQSLRKRRKGETGSRLDLQIPKTGECQIEERENQQQNYQIDEKFRKPLQESRNNLKISPEEETVTGEIIEQTLPKPYQFLIFVNPPMHTIFLPRFTVKSITFILTVIFVICFIVLQVYSHLRPNQNQLTWNCSIFELQNKYYPRIRYGFQFWRVPISFFFHSNILHFILNLIGIQIYGYFVEWYFDKVKYVITLVLSLVTSHLLSCICLRTTVSTTSSSALFAIFALKLCFLYQYREYKPLINRRLFIYTLFLLIFSINFIPIFVDNNVDYTAHIAGFVTGALMAVFFYFGKKEQPTKPYIFIKIASLILIGCIIIISIAFLYALPDSDGTYRFLNDHIKAKCSNPDL